VRLRGDDTRPLHAGIAVVVYKPVRPAQLLDALCRGLSIQLQREKKPPFAPALDANLARRLPLRLLLADDNPINQKVGQSVLHKLGYRSDIANNGREVLTALEQKAYDILFLDVQMPEMDGLEAARQICHRWPAESRPRIVAMTGNALTGDREKCLQAGMDDYISKPVRIAELQAALERWGPTRQRKSDTAFLSRLKPVPPETLLDQHIIAELRGMPPSDGVSMLQELVDLFLEGAPQRINLITQSISDAPNLAFHAHALKSMSLNLGARQIVELSQKLEELGRSGRVDGAPALLQDLQNAFAQTRSHLLPLRNH
jgi:CheY-like chemotaxis protein/HPt (histidine-containing phosphotransfer) domain-containing protein